MSMRHEKCCNCTKIEAYRDLKHLGALLPSTNHVSPRSNVTSLKRFVFASRQQVVSMRTLSLPSF